MRALWHKHRILIVSAAIILLPVLYGSLVALDIADLPGIAVRSEGLSPNNYAEPVQLAQLENKSINESSGIAASRTHQNIMWTHNDSGDGPFIYAIDREGRHRGTWRVTGAEAIDWEDIAVGPGPDRNRSYIYVGDIGDNRRSRDQIIVYRMVEPAVSAAVTTPVGNPSRSDTEPSEAIRLKYPDGKHDAEALLVNPSTGTLYVITKSMSAPARVYKLENPSSSAAAQSLTLVTELSIPNLMGGLITGGDISPDGLRVALCSYLAACELSLTDRKVPFDDVWKQSPAAINIGTRKQGESVCYRADGLAVLATSEGIPCPLIETARRSQ
jgi:hypothetical protein